MLCCKRDFLQWHVVISAFISFPTFPELECVAGNITYYQGTSRFPGALCTVSAWLMRSLNSMLDSSLLLAHFRAVLGTWWVLHRHRALWRTPTNCCTCWCAQLFILHLKIWSSKLRRAPDKPVDNEAKEKRKAGQAECLWYRCDS